MPQERTYILAPNFRIKPGSGAIALGNIIADPLRAHRPLTTVEDSRLETEYPGIEEFSEYGRQINRSESGEISMTVWAQFVQAVSAKASGSRGTSSETNYSMETLETKYFVTDPKPEEIKYRLKNPRIKAIVDQGWLPSQRKPVYMVTGIMVAKGFTAYIQRGKQHSCNVELGGSLPTVGVDIGIEVPKTHDFGDSESWSAGEDIVFAYQLLKIEVRGWKANRVEVDELRHKAAFLGNEDNDEDVDSAAGLMDGDISITKARLGDLKIPYSSDELVVSQCEAGEIALACICAPDATK